MSGTRTRRLGRNVTSKTSVGRMYSTMPGQGERHYLRILLGVVKGATSFEDLRTHAGVKHNTFKQAAIARGLLEHDAAQKQIMRDGAVLQFPLQLRNTFAELLAWEDVMNPVELWEEFKHDMCEDVLYRHRQAANDNNLQLSDDMMDEALLHIEKQLSQHHKSLSLFPGMPLPTVRNAMSSTEAAERAYDPEMLAASVAANMPLLNPEQKDVYDAVMQAVAASADAKRRLFFLDGPGGTGKTFVYSLA